MKASDSHMSKSGSTRSQSVASSMQKMGSFGKLRKVGKNVESVLLQQRQAFQVIENGIDITPKMLLHPNYSSINERQLTALEIISTSQLSSTGQLYSSSTLAKLPSIPTSSSMLTDNLQMKSLISTQMYEAPVTEDEDIAPPQFYLPSVDENEFRVPPKTVRIILKETETFFLFEMPQLTADLNTPEGQAIKEENERYEYITVGPGSKHRKLVDAETQTIMPLTKIRGTNLPMTTRKNQGVFVNNWVMYDTYAHPELMIEVDGRLKVRRKESLEQELEAKELQTKLPKGEEEEKVKSPEDEILQIVRLDSFQDALRVMKRIIASNIFLDAQKRFTGLIKQDPCSLDLEFTYSLYLLWTHSCEMSKGRPVSSFCWNHVNKTILAVAYGAQTGSDIRDGVLLIWCMKNPSEPGHSYKFDTPISDINWSRGRPNLLAVGFYDGSVKVVDVSKIKLNVIHKSKRTNSPATSPHWQVQWWYGDEQFQYKEQIYTSNQDGSVFCYRPVADFSSTTIMKIYRLEGKIPGVSRTRYCKVSDLAISRNPGAMVLRRHPTSTNIYFVGSDEGCIYKCSVNYLHQHIESFSAHDGVIYVMEFSPFSSKIFLTCGADWCTRIWVDGLTEPLITLSTTMACVRYAAWSPTYSTIIASIVNNEICIWDIKKKTYIPTSVTVSPSIARLVMVGFTENGNQLVTADVEGAVYVYNLEGMPFPPYNQQQVLIESIEKSLLTKPALLKKLQNLGPLS